MRSMHDSLTVPGDVSPYLDAGLVDLQYVRFVSLLLTMAGGAPRPLPALGHVALSLVLDAPRAGHTCVDFAEIGLWARNEDGSSPANLEWPDNPAPWLAALGEWDLLIARPENRNDAPRKPFVLDGTRLYAARSFDEELTVAAFLSANAGTTVRIITGGPGSGKTTEVASILISRIAAGATASPDGESLSIALAAPTGLAAKRMAKAISAAIHSPVKEHDVVLSEEQLSLIDAVPKHTVHKLLAYHPAAEVQYRHNAKNPLPYDVVIIDEVSMMPLSMMARVLDAMKEGSELLLVGDANQLASVEAGTVLADIVEGLAPRGEPAVTRLSGSWRFPPESPVGDLSAAINAGDVAEVNRVLDKNFPSGENDKRFVYVDSKAEPARVNGVARLVVDHARTLCTMAKVPRSVDELKALLEFRESLQVITAHRSGLYGVSGWNSSVERSLGPLVTGYWYLGRPVMVTQNDSVNGLSNGDIGVVCRDSENRTVVAFGDVNDVRTIPLARIPHVETVHALTIHKSQGSEYAHTIVVLPEKASRIVTRELLYTGITRAKPHLTLIAPRNVVEHAVKTPIMRASGLAGRLLG